MVSVFLPFLFSTAPYRSRECGAPSWSSTCVGASLDPIGLENAPERTTIKPGGAVSNFSRLEELVNELLEPGPRARRAQAGLAVRDLKV